MNRADPRRLVFLGPSPGDPDPALALRGNMRIETKGRRITATCPYCGARVSWRPKPGKLALVQLAHEPWCPVPTDQELLSRQQEGACDAVP